MKLNKRIARNILHNKSFYISSILLTMLTVALLIGAMSTGTVIDKSMNGLIDELKVEDAQFKTAINMDEDDIDKVEKKYDVSIEKQRYIEQEDGDKVLRVFSPNKDINLYKVTEGHDVSSDDEMLITKQFAVSNNLEIGDSYSIQDKNYKITGYFVRADYTYMLKNTSSAYIDNENFGLAIVNNDAMDNMEEVSSYYSIKYNKDNQKDTREYLADNYKVASYLAATSNTRIVYPRNQGEDYKSMGIIIAPVLFILVMIIIAVIIGRMIKGEQRQIGVLNALGYRKSEITKHYLRYPAIPGVVGSILGIAFSFFLTKAFLDVAFTDFEPIPYDMVYDKASMIVSIFLPTVLYLLTAFFVIHGLLRAKTIDLLSGNSARKKEKVKRIFVSKKLNFKTKYKIRALLSNPGRTLATCFGLLVASIVLVCGFIMKDSCQFIINNELDNVGDYEYQYYLNIPQKDKLDEGEGFLSYNFEVEGNTTLFNVKGIEEDSKYIKLKTISGNDIDYNKYYLTKASSVEYGVNAGDDFTFFDPITMKEHTVKVTDILDDNTQSTLFTGMKNAAELIGVDEGSYNGIMSSEEINISNDKVAIKTSKEKVKSEMENLLTPVIGVVYVLIAFGVLLCLMVIYLVVNMLIQENKNNISMLKVLGYRNKEINKMVLNTNHILVPICFLISIPIGIVICNLGLADTVENMSMYVESKIEIPSIIICFILILIGYFASLFILKRKVYKVNMVESLKDNRE